MDGAPRKVGRFEIHSLLGKGGMARVYRAFDPTLDREVALKVLHAPASADAEAAAQQRKRILREARAAAALTHPNTVTIYEVGEADGQPFIAMELLGGTTLRSAAEGDAPLATRLRWLLEAARALHAAHERGLVHRDVKPDNMIVDPDGRLKLLDFGIAKRDYGDAEAALAEIGLLPPEGPSSLRTGEGRRLGTPRYMAPEQQAGESTDARTDQYAWGLVAFELLTGALPEPGEDVAPALRGLALTEPVIAAIAHALAARKEDRAASLEEAIDAIEAAQERAAPVGSAPRRGRAVQLGAAIVLIAIATAGVVRWRLDGRALLDGPPSACRVASSRTIMNLAPNGVAVLTGGAVVAGYDADRTDAPASGVSLASVADGGVARFLPFGEDMPMRGAFVRSTTFAGAEAFVALLNRPGGAGDPSFALLALWLDGGNRTATHRFVIQASGIAVAPLEQGLVAALTYTSASREPGTRAPRFSAGLAWFKHLETPTKEVERYVSTNGALDSPAVAVSSSRVALVVRQWRKLVAVLVDHQLERAGDPLVLAEGDVGPPAVAYLGETLVVVWPEGESGKTRLRMTSLAPGATAFEKSRLVADEPVALVAPLFVPLATGGSLLGWIRSGADGTMLRAARFAPAMSRPFDLGRASTAEALSGLTDAEGAAVGWIDRAARTVVVADVACMPAMIP